MQATKRKAGEVVSGRYTGKKGRKNPPEEETEAYLPGEGTATAPSGSRTAVKEKPDLPGLKEGGSTTADAATALMPGHIRKPAGGQPSLWQF